MLHTSRSLFLPVTVLLFGLAVSAQGQTRLAPITSIGNFITCHVGGRTYQLKPHQDLIRISLTGRTEETQEIYDKVSDYADLVVNVYPLPVENSDVKVEICPGDVNYIVYNAAWLKSLYEETHNIWVLYGIMAHEIAHYVHNHDRTEIGSLPRLELQADEYAGKTLARMGASLEDAQAAFRSPKLRPHRATHPPIEERLAAVKRGWEKERAAHATNVNVSTTSITEGPVELKDSVYKGGADNSLSFRFKSLPVEFNATDDLTKEALKITKQSGTHVGGNKPYYWSSKKSKRNLLLAWRNLEGGFIGWVVVQRHKDRWFYKSNGGDWAIIDEGVRFNLRWENSGQTVRISLYLPKTDSGWSASDIQYGFGIEN